MRGSSARLLRCETLWGEDELTSAAPAIRHAPEAIYLPKTGSRPWGLYAHGRRLGEGGAVSDAASSLLPTSDGVEHGPFLYIGDLATHYGHFLVDTLPNLWPLLDREGPRPRLLCHGDGSPDALRERWSGLDFLNSILGRLGYAVADLVILDRPVRVTDVLVPEPCFRGRVSAHPSFGELCRRIGRAFWSEAEVDGVSRPVYLSKTGLDSGIARIVNEAAIVAELERRGVEIAYPETLPFSEQVRLLSSRRIVLGSVGSAFHTSAFAAPGRRLVGLNFQQALSTNFSMIDALVGTRARYYHPHGTRYEDGTGWQLGWVVSDPEGVAAALLDRADWLARGEPDDPGRLAAIRRRIKRPLRTLLGRARR